MGYTYRQELTKFEYSISLAAALGYLMIHQQDPVGLIAFDQQGLAEPGAREQAVAARQHPLAAGQAQARGDDRDRGEPAPGRRHAPAPQPGDALQRPAGRSRLDPAGRSTGCGSPGHDLIVFHILDEAEALFPFEGMVELEDNETHETIEVDADAIKADYLEEVDAVPDPVPKPTASGARIDYVPLHTGMPFDKALMSYLLDAASPGLMRSTRCLDPAMEMSLTRTRAWRRGRRLAALPVILHLFMRQTPKHVIFPALRLIRERQRRSKKRLRVKNWLLLLARMALLALMALALARPTLYSQVPLGDQSVPDGPGPGLRHQPVDGIQGEGQDPAGRGQGAGPRDRLEAPRLEPGLRGRLVRAGRRPACRRPRP